MNKDYVKHWDEQAQGGRYAKAKWFKRSDLDEINYLCDMIGSYLSPGSLILDVGSGSGLVYHIMEKKQLLEDNQFVMCDISPDLRKLCFCSIDIMPDIIQMDFAGNIILPYKDNSFDLVLAQSVLMHNELDNANALLGEMVRCSRKYIYIAGYTHGNKRLKPFNFKHDYEKMAKKHGLGLVIKKNNLNTKGRSIYFFELKNNI